MRFAGVGGLLVGCVAFTVGASAEAGTCGQEVACRCGDTLRGETVLTQDLRDCPDDGLRLVGDAVLDCAGHEISGRGAGEGLLLDQAHGATVRDCRLSHFNTGVRLRGGSANVVSHNSIVDSVRYGIDLARGSSKNVLWANLVGNSGDEGIHVGAGADQNQIVGNEIKNSGAENLYVLSSRGGIYAANLLSRSGAAAIYVKHTSDSIFAANEIADQIVHVRGHAVGNFFANNLIEKGRFVFEAYKDRGHAKAVAGWTRPTRNRVVGGAVLDTRTCFQFKGVVGNQVDAVAVTHCRSSKESKKGGLAASGNEVSVIDWVDESDAAGAT